MFIIYVLDETKMDEQEGEDVGEKPTDDAAADLDKNEDDNPNEIDPGLQAAVSFSFNSDSL